MKFDQRLEEYRTFLKSSRNKLGKPYSESYIKNISYQIQQLLDAGFNPSNHDHIEQISIMNRFIKNRRTIVYSTIRGFITYLRYLRYIDEEIRNVHMPPMVTKNPRRIKTLSKAEIDKLRDGADNPVDRLIVELLYYIPLDKYQIYRIKIEDIDFDKKEIVVVENGIKIKKFFEERLKKDLKEHIGSQSRGLVFPKLSDYVIYYRIRNLSKKILGKPVSPQEITLSRINILRNKGLPLEHLIALTGRSGQTLIQYPPISEEKTKKLIKKYSD